ncbi:hypothetical protein WKT22_01448 [Candidatus Lokiarchaeum ossiferum]
MVRGMATGIVKWFNYKKGYGFISLIDDSENAKDVFVHFSAIVGESDQFKTLHQEDKVTFEIVDGDKGPVAQNVVVIEAAPKPVKKNKSESVEAL